MPGLRIGVDSGGTFVDVCILEEDSGRMAVWKVSSTPSDPSEAIIHGVIGGLGAARLSLDTDKVVYFGHGTTVATNALIQRRGVDVGVITTRGFRDLLELRRQKRPSVYDPQADQVPPLASRDKRIEIDERILFDGTTETPLDEEALRRAALRLKEMGVEAVAVSFLFSFVEPAHEQAARRIITEVFPEGFLSISHEVAPETGEFERLSTTVMNSYVGPIIRTYLRKLGDRLAAAGISSPIHLTQSNGGIISSETAERFPVRTILSGPAAGVTGAAALGRIAGYENLITFDMGGTSTDVALVDGGRLHFATDNDMHGYPLRISMLDINTVGAGGGSIAHIDAGRLLKVGPASAGADPGPACYGRGNTQPTVTDANIMLGVLNQTELLGGRLPIDAALSKEAIGDVAGQLGLDPMAVAQGIISIVTANMAKAIRVISVERGYDPRDYVLVAFGGAGPLHASRLARELDIPRVLIPRHPGILCAMGLLLTDLRNAFSRTWILTLKPETAARMEGIFRELEGRAVAWFEEEGLPAESRKVLRTADMRYRGQGHELKVPLPEGEITAGSMAALRAAFEDDYARLYGVIAEDEDVEVVSYRLEAVGTVASVGLDPFPPADAPVEAALTGSRRVHLLEAGGLVTVPLYNREKLGPGHRIAGPAIIEQMDSTTLVLPDQRVTVDPYLNLVIEN